MTKQRTFRVVYERDDNGRWFVRCPDVQGAHSHGRTLPSSRENIREAIAIVLDLEDDTSFGLSEEIRLRDSDLQQAIDEATSQRADARRLERLAAQATREAISESTASKDALSNRDLAELLGLSHQRVQQLASELRQQ
ncbi:MAG: type II toxin-antitoxin system HicB family antitoxin [Acidimicrobiia bacterium]